MSAFATIVGRLGELSESELRQLYLVVGVRLGFPDGAAPGAKPQAGGKSSGKKGTGKTGIPSKGAGKSRGKGNPSRKSQWETHPLYLEYKRLKRVVETQAKEAKTSFNEVDTPERSAYQVALSQWLEAKSSFRGRNTAQKEGAEATSAKGKEKEREALSLDVPMDVDQPGPSGSGASWADEAQAAADASSSGSEQGEDDSTPAVVEKADSAPSTSGKSTRGGAPARGRVGRGRGR